jgi:plasmid stabilization system protein ParE
MSAEAIEFHPEAAEEAQAAVEWYRKRSLRAAEGFVRELEEAVRAVSEAPHRWPEFIEGTRRYPLRRFPYWLIYREKHDSLQILAVAHARRRPGYWRRRGEGKWQRN